MTNVRSYLKKGIVVARSCRHSCSAHGGFVLSSRDRRSPSRTPAVELAPIEVEGLVRGVRPVDHVDDAATLRQFIERELRRPSSPHHIEPIERGRARARSRWRDRERDRERERGRELRERDRRAQHARSTSTTCRAEQHARGTST